MKEKNIWKETPTYRSWATMIQRCTNTNNTHYSNYGGRGIVVCDKWRIFKNFLEDMGVRPEGKSIDRKDSNGNYCKENCKWSTRIEQGNNMRTNKPITFNGKTQTTPQWARDLGINKGTLASRLVRQGWSIERALTEGIGKYFVNTDHKSRLGANTPFSF